MKRPRPTAEPEEESRTVSPARRDEDAAEASLRPQTWPTSPARRPRARTSPCSSGREGPRRGVGPCAAAWPARPRQNHAGADRRARTGGWVPRHLGAGDPARRRPRGDPDQSAAARRAVHRRDPPAAAGDRGNPVSGDGGFSARPDHRRRARRPQRAHRPAAVHAGRRDHAVGPAGDAVTRPVRHSVAADFLHARGIAPDRHPRRRACWA